MNAKIFLCKIFLVYLFFFLLKIHPVLQTKNLFTFYGSPVRQNRNKYTSSAKYKKTNSRPNTSVSKQVILLIIFHIKFNSYSKIHVTYHYLHLFLQSVINNEVSQLSVNSELYITASEYTKYN